MEQAWLTATFVALAILHVLVLCSVLRARRSATRRNRRASTPTAVRCPDCTEVNEPGYRFCRRCVTRLPGGATGGEGGSPPASRTT